MKGFGEKGGGGQCLGGRAQEVLSRQGRDGAGVGEASGALGRRGSGRFSA